VIAKIKSARSLETQGGADERKEDGAGVEKFGETRRGKALNVVCHGRVEKKCPKRKRGEYSRW